MQNTNGTAESVTRRAEVQAEESTSRREERE